MKSLSLMLNQRVVIVGASASAADIAFDLAHHKTAQTPVHTITIDHTANGYFENEAFAHPRIKNHASIARVDAASRTVHLVDGTSIAGVDSIILGTGYTWTFPLLPGVEVQNNRVPGLYQHVVWQKDPTLLFVGAVAAGLTFEIFEWQAVLAARLLAGRAILPSAEEMSRWESERVAEHGDGVRFTLVFPGFEEYFEAVRKLAGEPAGGVGRALPPFKPEWGKAFLDGHQLRNNMWKRPNAQVREEARPKL